MSNQIKMLHWKKKKNSINNPYVFPEHIVDGNNGEVTVDD